MKGNKLSDIEARVVARNPILAGLSGISDIIKQVFDINASNPTPSLDDDEEESVKHIVGLLMWSAQKLTAAKELPSRLHYKNSLHDDLRLASKDNQYLVKANYRFLLTFFTTMLKPPTDEEFWCGVYELVALILAPTLAAQKQDLSWLAKSLKSLHTSWNVDFYGDANKALKEKIQALEAQMMAEAGAPTYYCKLIPIIQSSGMGKSRLVDETSKDLFTISFTLRSGEESGYPPGDPEVTEYMDSSLEMGDAHMHARAAALIAAAFGQAHEWMSKSVDVTPLQWHDYMAPLDISTTPGLELGAQGTAKQFALTRSSGRKEFCRKVTDSAGAIYKDLIRDQNWLGMFNCDDFLIRISKHSVIQQTLLRSARKLTKQRSGRTLLLVFDEVSRLFPGGFEDTGFITALRRILQVLRPYPIWTLVLSTQSCAQYFSIAEWGDASGRVRDGSLKRVDPFYALRLDVEMYRRLNNPTSSLDEKEKPLRDFATAEHMTKYGRPMLYGYRSQPPEELRKFLLGKLLCIQREPIIAYNVNNIDHIFATIASRVALDPCLNTAQSTVLAQNAVNRHLRIILHLDTFAGIMHTTTPAEPIIAEATAWLLTRRCPNGDLFWSSSIEKLTMNLLSPGLVEKGLRGELYVRILFIVARDILLDSLWRLAAESLSSDSDSEDDHDTVGNEQPSKNLKTKGESCSLPSRGYYFASTFKLIQLLEVMFGKDTMMALGFVLGGNPRKYTNESVTLSGAFENAWCNFSHFVITDKKLKPENMPELLHNLMHSQAALQCCFNQSSFDILIPVYLGNPAEKFDQSKLTGFLVQVKNKSEATKFIVCDSDITDFYGKNFDNPTIFMLLDLCTQKTIVKGVESPSANSYGLYASGDGSFDFLKVEPSLQHSMKGLLSSLVPKPKNAHDQICDENLRYRYHTWSQRFTQIGA
ncbi:hypothetical protein BDD12DRAFT_803959 [Trichophaea hybrida]|nr:hypothetical protein BDD12DRAFT_803959 [Trichophaea hybrida]